MSQLRERNGRRMEGRAPRQAAVAVSCDEMWTYPGAKHGAKGEERRIWTAVVREAGGGRSEEPFLRLYERLPAERHVAGKGSAVNWNEEPAPEKAGGCIRRGGASWTG